MPDRVHLIDYGESAIYNHGRTHPLRPERVLLTIDLIEAYGILDRDSVTRTTARDATDEEIQLVHTPEYVEAVKKAGSGKRGPWWQYGFGPGDNPIFPHMHEASARVAGATLKGAELIVAGEADHVFNPAGGLHHAMAGRASGFCVYDDPAVAIAWMLRNGVEKVAYVDVDCHHGDGVQEIFYDEPRVLTLSIHQSGRTLFPGTGFVDELGRGEAEGTSVNIPLPPFTPDELWLEAFTSVVPPLLEAWRPDVLVTQLGCDTHCTDPLTNMLLTTTAFRRTATLLHDLAHRTAGGKWLATGGGGYQWATVVPRAWTIYFADMAEFELADEIPSGWLEHAQSLTDDSIPSTLSEPEITGSPVTEEDVHAVIDEVKETVFPYHGL